MKPPKSKRGSRTSDAKSLTVISEDSIAQRFAEENAESFCFIRDWNCWLKWNGETWKRDAKDSVIEAIRRLCRLIAAAEPDPRKAERLTSLQKVRAIEQLARSDLRLSVDADRWDRDPWEMNTPDGIVCLRSGEYSSHDPSRYLMKQTSVSPQGNCERWLKFINIITGGDTELANYLQQLAGYCLTGSVAEQVFFYLWGTGANGKSVFTAVLTEILGTYSKFAAPGMLTASFRDRHPTELAMLQGSRLVIASELAKDDKLDINKLKFITGGDRLVARKMNQDFSEFTPTFKLILVGNALPSLSSIDEAIRRRIRIIPFIVTIPPEKRDPDLVGTLLSEGDGILAWALKGCLDYQRNGLRTPACVKRLTENHLYAADPINRFIQERCEVGKSFCTGSSDIYSSWRSWSIEEDEYKLTQSAFIRDLVSRGFQRRREPKKRSILGLRLKPDIGELS